MPPGTRPARGPVVVEPIGFAVTQFLASIGLVAGIGLAPDGLLLFAAAVLLSVIDLRRFSEANPGLVPQTAEAFDTPRGRILFRLSMQSTAVIAVLCVLSAYFVHRDHARAACLGPALVAGVVTLWINWRLKRALTRVTVKEALAARMVDREQELAGGQGATEAAASESVESANPEPSAPKPTDDEPSAGEPADDV